MLGGCGYIREYVIYLHVCTRETDGPLTSPPSQESLRPVVVMPIAIEVSTAKRDGVEKCRADLAWGAWVLTMEICYNLRREDI